MLRGPVTRRTAILATLVAVTVFAVTTAISGIVTNDSGTTPVLLIVLGMGTATLLPWGVGPQLVVQAIVAASIIGEHLDRPRSRRADVAAAGDHHGLLRVRVCRARRSRATSASAGVRRRPRRSCGHGSTRPGSRTRPG